MASSSTSSSSSASSSVQNRSLDRMEEGSGEREPETRKPAERGGFLSSLRFHRGSAVSPNAIDYVPHQGEGRQYWRDIILGVNDGLVSMILLIVGVVGGGFDSHDVLLTGITGGVAGAISMGLGEYLATKSQLEVTKGDMELEQQHLTYFRHIEEAEIREQLEKWNVKEPTLSSAVQDICENDENMLSFMKVIEFGQNEDDIRSPYTAMITAFFLFGFGSLPSILPFIWLDVHNGIIVALVLAGACLFVVGAVKCLATGGNVLYSGCENLFICAIGVGISYGIGLLYNQGNHHNNNGQ